MASGKCFLLEFSSCCWRRKEKEEDKFLFLLVAEDTGHKDVVSHHHSHSMNILKQGVRSKQAKICCCLFATTVTVTVAALPSTPTLIWYLEYLSLERE